ncbi:hypothetical protein GCM10018966_010780 [Streptomyces yanii]
MTSGFPPCGAAREAGALTLAVTDNPDSPLAAVSEYHIDILAGPDKALPATKTCTASLLSLYLFLFVEGLRGGDGGAAASLPELAEAILARKDEVKDLAARYRFAERTDSRGGEALQPILEILPLQMLAHEVTIARWPGPGCSPRPGQGHRDPLTAPVSGGGGPQKHPRAAAPGRDPQPVRHRSPELLGRRCAVPPAGGGTGAVRAESAVPRSTLLCGESGSSVLSIVD